MNISFCIFGNEEKYEIVSLKREIENRGGACVVLDPVRVQMSIVDGECYIKNNKYNIKDFDIYIFRQGNYINQYIYSMISGLENKLVFENYLNAESDSKFSQYIKLTKGGINVPNTYFIGKKRKMRLKSIRKNILNFKFPLILKTRGSKGDGVFIVNNVGDILNTVSLNSDKEFILQEKLGDNKDIRVLVLNGEVVGGFLRSRDPSDLEFRTNKIGAEKIALDLNEDIKKIAINAAKSCGIIFAGVDIIEHNNSYYVLEVNSTPQYKTFDRITNINVSERIIDYLLKSYSR